MTDRLRAIVPVRVASELEESAPVHPVEAYIASLPALASRRTMRAALDLVSAIAGGIAPDAPERTGSAMAFAWWRLRSAQTRALRARLAEGYSPNTANKALSALRGVLRSCRRQGLMSGDEATDALDFKGVPGSREPAGRALARSEVVAITAAAIASSSITAVRDLAVLGLLAGAGLRRKEIASLPFDAYEASTGRLRVLGKGNKVRTVPLGPTPRAWLDAWIAARQSDDGSMFVRLWHGGRALPTDSEALSAEAIYASVRRAAQSAGIDPMPTPHDFRRTFITELLDQNTDVFTVARLAGHSQIETTRRYDRRPERSMAAATETLDSMFRTPKEER